MSSRAYALWESAQQGELDRLETAHLAVRGAGARPVCDAYIVLLAAHFQQYCRDWHSEAVTILADTAPHMSNIIEKALIQGRQLDRGNATPSSLGADFGRLELPLWDRLGKLDGRSDARKKRLEQLNVWRSAIAHRDFHFSPHVAERLAGTGRTLAFARTCRAACRALAPQPDAVVAAHLAALVGRAPW